MCYRYVFVPTPGMLVRFELEMSNRNLMDMDACYNIGPGFTVPVVVKHSPNHIEMMRWGLIPPWAKDIKIGFKMANARSETITEKPSFKGPFKRQRCVIPANGFFEWKETAQGRIPQFITIPDTPTFGMAGLYEIARDGEGKEIKSFTIITCPPNRFMASIHNRMPVILQERDYEPWLDTKRFDDLRLLAMLQPYAGEMKRVSVSSRVNNVANQGKELIYPV